MTKTFTQDDLIRYIYDEMSEDESSELRKALIVDSGLQEQLKELAAVKNHLDHSLKQPSNRAVQNILNYSKAFDTRIQEK